MKATWTLYAAATLLWTIVGICAVADDKKRNPFDVPDIDDVDGEATQEYAKNVELKGDKDDANASQWVTEASDGKKGSLDGDWQSRWNGKDDPTSWHRADGTTRIKTVGDRVFILYKDGNSTYLIDTKRTKDRLVGRYKNLDDANDAGGIVLKVVDDERLDGDWAGNGRWDFRRKLK